MNSFLTKFHLAQVSFGAYPVHRQSMDMDIASPLFSCWSFSLKTFQMDV